MNILFVHQNFPGQFRHIAAELVHRGHLVYALGMASATDVLGVKLVKYAPVRGNGRDTYPEVVDFESKIIRAHAAYVEALGLKKSGFCPDVIYSHPGWGESIFLREVWPRAKVINYLEFFYKMKGGDIGFDPEYPVDDASDVPRLRVKNAHMHLALEEMDLGIAPTQWQKSTFPSHVQSQIEVCYDGVDTDVVRPNPNIHLQSASAGIDLRSGQEVVTFVNRNLEPCRGFHSFMRSLPRILKSRPQAKVLIVGDDAPGYGPPPKSFKTWREALLEEVGREIDLRRVFFVGKVNYQTYLAILQISAVHVYLTYPFVLSWSFFEALSAGCLVIGSKTSPVTEFLRDDDNGLLVDFFNSDEVANRVIDALSGKVDVSRIRQAARNTILEKHDLKRLCLPHHVSLIENMV